MSNQVGICILTGTLEDTRAAAESDADYVELPVAPMLMNGDRDEFDALVKQLGEMGAEVPTCNLLIPAGMRLTGPEADFEVTKTHMREAIERMSRLGVSLVGFGAGGSRSVAEGESRDQALDQLEAVLRFTSDAAADNGMTVALEPLRREETNVFTTVAETEQFVRERDLPRLKMMLDNYQSTWVQEPIESIRSIADLLVHAHISDRDRIPPGFADWDLGPLFRELAGIDYRGRLSIEVFWPDIAGQANEAVANVRAKAAEAGLGAGNGR